LITALSEGRGYGEGGGEGLFFPRRISNSLTHRYAVPPLSRKCKWLETERSEGQVRESGRPARAGAERVVAGKLPVHYHDGAGRSQSAHSSDEGP
jgi:hypothetical protein